jgi:hypothetical protein
MKRTVVALLLILAFLFFELAGTQFKVIEGQLQNPNVMIQRPENKTYATNTVSVDIFAMDGGKALVKIAYQIDSEAEVIIFSDNPTMGHFRHGGNGNATLYNLSNGRHHLKATATWTWWTPPYFGYPTSSSEVDFIVDTVKLGISVYSPLNKTYNSNVISLIIVATKPVLLTYSLDGEPNVDLAANATLAGLSDGNHNLLFNANDAAGNSALDRVYFAVDTKTPIISNSSLNVNVENATEASLYFTVDESVQWIGYSLDGKENVTINGNTTLTDLSSGKHSLTIYSNDTAGNMGSSGTTYFNVPESFPTTLVAASIIVIAFLGVGLLVYFKKRGRQS